MKKKKKNYKQKLKEKGDETKNQKRSGREKRETKGIVRGLSN